MNNAWVLGTCLQAIIVSKFQVVLSSACIILSCFLDNTKVCSLSNYFGKNFTQNFTKIMTNDIAGVIYHRAHNSMWKTLRKEETRGFKAFSFPFAESLPHRIVCPVVNNACYVIGHDWSRSRVVSRAT